MKILIADDEKIIRTGIKTLIERAGRNWTVTGEAINGVKALELMKISAPDVIITDIRMPEMDGIELVRQLRLNYPEVLTIVISGYAEFQYAKEAIKYGAIDYILKPTKLEDLINALSKAEEVISNRILASRKEKKLIEELEELRSRMKAEGLLDNSSAPEQIDSENKQQRRKIIDLALGFINSNYAGDLTLKKIAEVVYMNPNYLCDLFKQETGTFFSDYLTKVRIEKAKELLSTRMELKSYEVADLVGYKDARYFSQVFKRYIGVSPSEFRDGKT